MAIRNVIGTLTDDGQELMGPGVLLFHHPSNDIQNGTLLTVESNHFCVLKSRGAILDVYETGQYPVQTPQRAILGSFQQAFYGGSSPWQYEVLYTTRSKNVINATGTALSSEMAELSYSVDYYVHVDTKDDAIKVVQHMPYAGHALTSTQLNEYAGPVVEQAINQIVQVTPMESINEHIHELTDLVKAHLQDFLSNYGFTLSDVKVLVAPKDERMRELISLRAFGLSELDAVRYYLALKMADRGLVSAPNAAVGEGYTQTAVSLLGMPGATGPAVPAPAEPGGAAPARSRA
ncbi:MAG: SPFH domain-containing protein [Acidimicrobiales bacterium]